MSETGVATEPAGGATPPATPSAASVLTTPPATPPAGDGSAQAPADAKWYGKVDADTEAYIQNKGWKGPMDLFKSYTNLERLRGVGADKLVKLPDPANKEEVDQFYSRLGVPAEAKGYSTPENLEFELDKDVLANLSHAAKLTPQQHEMYVKGAAAYFKQLQEQQVAQIAERDAAEKATLEREWGPLKDENYAAATKAASRFGLGADELNKLQAGLGYKGTVELLAKIGRSFGEGKGASKDPEAAPMGVTPSVASERLNQLMRDEGFRAKLFSGDTDARERWESLKKVAFGG